MHGRAGDAREDLERPGHVELRDAGEDEEADVEGSSHTTLDFLPSN
jgi:hypothetical protein